LQRDITIAAGKTALAEHPALWERFETTLEKVNELAGERNAAVHTMWARLAVLGYAMALLSKSWGRVGGDPARKT
jgi:hypothetical protein